MKIKDIKYLREWYNGSLSGLPKHEVIDNLQSAEQQKYHIAGKNTKSTAFVFLYKYDTKHFCYIIVNKDSNEYIGYCLFQLITPEIWQPIATEIEPAYRGDGFAPQLYAYVSYSTEKWIINAAQLSKSAENMWKKFPNCKIYNKEENKFYEKNDSTAGDPEQDKSLQDQKWFLAFKELREGFSEAYMHLGSNFNYDLFLAGKPAFILENGLALSISPGTPDLI
jgi:GNAT superfamily N-acetyltransferase